MVLQDAATVRKTLESVLSSDVYYINLKDEPTLYCVNEPGNAVKLDRIVRSTYLRFISRHVRNGLECLLNRRLM